MMNDTTPIDDRQNWSRPLFGPHRIDSKLLLTFLALALGLLGIFW